MMKDSGPIGMDEIRAPLLRDVLRGKAASAVMRVSSGSMAPRLAEGDRIKVEAVAPRSLRPGDVVVFESEAAGLVVHRLIWRDRPLGRPTRIYTRGDALDRMDRSVPVERVVGRVVSVTREESRFNPTTRRDRLRCWMLAAGLGLRRWGRALFGRYRGDGREAG